MGPRGRSIKFKKSGKNNFKSKSSFKGKQSQRKTYSLYNSNKNGNDFKLGSKRKATYKDRNAYDVDDTKRAKLEGTLPVVAQESTSESEEDEVEDHMKQLCETFGSVHKKAVAIESSDDSDLENDSEGDDESQIDNDATSSSENEENVNTSGSIIEADTVSDTEPNLNIDLLESKDEEEEIDLEAQKEDDLDNSKDPFACRLFYELSESLLQSVQSTPMLMDSSIETWPELGKISIQIPKFEEKKEGKENRVTISEEQPNAPKGTRPVRINPLKEIELCDLHIKTQIAGQIHAANKSLNDYKSYNLKLPFTPLQSEIFSVVNNYQDFYYTQRTFENAEQIRFVYCLHAINHILKTRTKVLHHNARLSKKEDVPEEFRDQGLVRPKILIIVPFKDAAYKIVQMFIDILIAEDKGNVINKNRFLVDFTGNEIAMPKKNPKPEDYELLFCGNTSDDFKIGMTITKKSLKLYADFYSSDIIIASPLGLRCVIGAEGESERDFDFLASVELLVLDQTDIFLMQNWDHLLHAFKHLHLQPKESHGTDFSRVRTWSLNGWAKYYRQTLMFSSVQLPEINSIFNKRCFNYMGRVKTVNPTLYGSIRQVFVQLPHVFHRFETTSVAAAMDERFEFFIGKILPQQQDTLMKQTLIFVSNYFDYVRLRNYFKREDVGFVQVCEYSKESKVARARDMFFHGDAHFMLYTERYHFFNRVRVKGIRHLVFYQLPVFPHFYYEMCNLMQEGNMNKKVGNMSNMTVTVLYSKYDAQQLASVVGTERASKMAQSDRNVHMLLTDAD